MSFNGAGLFQNNTAGVPVVTGTTISSSMFNLYIADVATGLSTTVCKDGQQTTTGVIPFALGLSLAGGSTLSSYVQPTAFTPTLLSGGNQVGRTYTTQTGKYVRVGGVVHFWASISLSAVGSSTGDTTIAALPFTSATTAGMLHAVAILADDLAAGVTTALGAYIASNSAAATIGSFAAGQFTTLQETGLTASAAIYIAGSYPV